MFICTSQSFAKENAKKTLLGELALEWPEPWIKTRDLRDGTTTFEEFGKKKKESGSKN
jgi:hypothetical protein